MPLSKSQQMARVRSQHTSPEKHLRLALWRVGLRYRLHARTPVGRPDLVFLGAKVAVFVDGCFWHGCPEHYSRPQSTSEFWATKLLTNVRRDRSQTQELERLGWIVVRIWECEVFDHLASSIERIREAVKGNRGLTGPDWRVVRVIPTENPSIEIRELETLRDPIQVQRYAGLRVTGRRVGMRPIQGDSENNVGAKN